MIRIYSSDCPKCKVLKSILEREQMDFVEENDNAKINEVASIIGARTLPIMEVIIGDINEFYTFTQAVEKIKELKEGA